MSSFGFLASAAALGGFFTRPFKEPVPVQAASMLPSVGGYGSARVENYRFHELISFKAAYTVVIGNEYEKDGRRERSTLALAVVEGLNVLDMVTADRVVGRLVSETPLPMDKSDKAAQAAADAQELTWLPAGSYFVNLRIGGHPVGPLPHEPLAGKNLLMAGRNAFSDKAAAGTCAGVEKLPGVRPGQPLRCSMFAQDHQYHIAGFGDVFLGEYVVGRDYRKLTMIRLDMGSPEDGEVSVASLQGNGSPY
jgi:hypothetical protein